MKEEENYGYILRISEDKWVKQVFEIKKFYTAVRRKWHRGTNILLAKKTDIGDSFIGYGVVGKVEHLWELPPEEEAYCQENNWKIVISFKALTRFKNPYRIKDTFLAGDPRNGSLLHGARLSEQHTDDILEAAEELQG